MSLDSKNKTEKLIANNKKAFYDYFIEKEIQCGISLCGTEVKSLREGKCSIKEAFIRIINGEALIMNMNISPYEKEIFLIEILLELESYYSINTK